MNIIHLPGQVENWVLVVNVSKLGVTEIPRKILGNVIGCLSDNYRCMSKRMFILNTSWTIKMGWKIVEAFLQEHTRRKISLTDSHTHDEL